MQRFGFKLVEYRYSYSHLLNKLSSYVNLKSNTFLLHDANEFPAEILSHHFQHNQITPALAFSKSKDRFEVIKAFVRIDQGEQLNLQKLGHHQVKTLIELIKVPQYQNKLKKEIISTADSLTYGQTAIAASVFPTETIFANRLKLKNMGFDNFEEMLYMIKWLLSNNLHDKEMENWIILQISQLIQTKNIDLDSIVETYLVLSSEYPKAIEIWEKFDKLVFSHLYAAMPDQFERILASLIYTDKENPRDDAVYYKIAEIAHGIEYKFLGFEHNLSICILLSQLGIQPPDKIIQHLAKDYENQTESDKANFKRLYENLKLDPKFDDNLS
ncbi:unnamed protein product [Blepharisma stoltei]|uniref:Uncharacterized protein n=1 Tax=Blepharisma stoltei TaxID=1481888 RepID=A0AAU9IP31_9CILI|nr:unnamed protein product [Blepharisma stoltei]